jgi:ATP-binding cassette subfamily B protein
MIILFAIEPLLFLLFLPVGIPFLVFQWRLSRRQFEELDSRVKKERWMGYYSGLLNDVELAGEIKLFRLGKVFIARWDRIMDEFRSLRLNYQWFELLGNLLFSLFSVLAIYLALTHAVTSIVNGQRTIGDLAIFIVAAAQLRTLIESSVALIASLRWQLLHVALLRKFFSISSEIGANMGKSPINLAGDIEFRNVTFRYPGTATDILKNISFTITAGENIALVGANGAGKSTIVKLIAGFYQPQQGTILFDGQEISQLDPQQLQGQIAVMFQTFGRYMATAADNIAFGDWQRLEGNQTSIEAVARKAGVDRIISAMPRQYETLLGRQFSHYQPSSGQWQQLAIARLIARDARILILDEPTASLDVTTEAELFQQFQYLSAGRTTLLISHRFSTVSMADRIMVIDEGQIIESGTHKDLVSQAGQYATLYKLSQRFTENR